MRDQDFCEGPCTPIHTRTGSVLGVRGFWKCPCLGWYLNCSLADGCGCRQFGQQCTCFNLIYPSFKPLFKWHVQETGHLKFLCRPLLTASCPEGGRLGRRIW